MSSKGDATTAGGSSGMHQYQRDDNATICELIGASPDRLLRPATSVSTGKLAA